MIIIIVMVNTKQYVID